MARLDLYRLNRALHRDLGYFVCALTIVYSVSGLAVNHVADWDPNRTTTVEAVSIGPLTGSLDELERQLVERLELDRAEVTGRHRTSPTELRVFLEGGGEARVDVTTGAGTVTRIHHRPGLYEVNLLHLNHVKGAWTWIADAYAVILLYLAVGGLFMIKGKRGFFWRGFVLSAAGALLPVAFAAWYRWTH